MMTDTLTADEQAQLRHTFTVRHPGVVAMDTRPTVLYRVTTDHAGNVIMRDLRAEAIREYERGETMSLRDFARQEGVEIDPDEEPIGDPVGLGMPRRRMTLLGALWHVATWKLRRVGVL